jgi:formylglycine-generating enzyme required for sulfatase activity
MLQDFDKNCYSFRLSEVSNLNESKYYRMRFSAGQDAVNARRMNYNSYLDQLVIGYFPSGPVPIIMVPIEGGTFQMGDEWGEGYSYERPMHSVTLSPFSLSKYEVTNEQMREVMQWAYDRGKVTAASSTVRNAQGNSQELLNLNSSWCQISWNGSSFVVDTGKEDYPCVEVTWYGSVAFCNYLSEMESWMPCYNLSTWECDWNAGGYRLPTEAEWEYAAKGGGNGQKTKYAGSDNIDEVAWYFGNSGYRSHEVGTKVGNELGIHDLSGNVWEWCWDWSGSYSSGSVTDPRGPASGGYRVVRGGSWLRDARYCRVAYRYSYIPDSGDNALGFRLARTVSGR